MHSKNSEPEVESALNGQRAVFRASPLRPVRKANPYSAATTARREREPVTSARSSETPPSIAPSRLAPNAAVEDPASRKRWLKMRLARKIGAKATLVAARKRGTGEKASNDSCGTAQARARA